MKKHRLYELKEYDKNWKVQFKDKARRIRKILGNEIIQIYHIGSTSIPGMVAKPQIDVLVVVKNLKKIKNYYNAMSSNGFTHLGDYTGIGEECFAEDRKDGIRLATIHVVPKGHKEISDQLNFRNYLRKHKSAREDYSKLKKKLYSKYANDYPSYANKKKSKILQLKRLANKWAKRK